MQLRTASSNVNSSSCNAGMTTTSTCAAPTNATCPTRLHKELPPEPEHELQNKSLDIDCSKAFESVVPFAPPPTVLFADVLLVKKKLFGGFDKKFFFVLEGISDLFTCSDELVFSKWISLGKLLDDACPASIRPVRVLRILRATRDSSVNDQAITIVTERINQPNKLQYKTFYAESKANVDKWIDALQQVQVSKRAHPRHGHHGSQFGQEASDGSMTSRMDAMHATFTTTSSSPGASSRHGFDTKASITMSSVRSYHSNSSASNSVRGGDDACSIRGDGSCSNNQEVDSTTPSGNVTLFVPTTGTTLANSESKIAWAKQELESLLQHQSRRLPERGLPRGNNNNNNNNAKEIVWRYGFPDYLFTDLTYLKGKTRDHAMDSTEHMVETLCQTFSMEATHKKQYSQWTSVVHEYFTIRVNDSAKLPGDLIQENDFFGLLLFNKSIRAKIPNLRSGEHKPPAVMLAEAFTEGFPFEVLDVFTQPPVCHFAWRQWGQFTGQFKGQKGDGSLLEIRGFGRMTLKSNRLLGLYLFFKPNEIFDALEAHVLHRNHNHSHHSHSHHSHSHHRHTSLNNTRPTEVNAADRARVNPNTANTDSLTQKLDGFAIAK